MGYILKVSQTTPKTAVPRHFFIKKISHLKSILPNVVVPHAPNFSPSPFLRPFRPLLPAFASPPSLLPRSQPLSRRALPFCLPLGPTRGAVPSRRPLLLLLLLLRRSRSRSRNRRSIATSSGRRKRTPVSTSVDAIKTALWRLFAPPQPSRSLRPPSRSSSRRQIITTPSSTPSSTFTFPTPTPNVTVTVTTANSIYIPLSPPPSISIPTSIPMRR